MAELVAIEDLAADSVDAGARVAHIEGHPRSLRGRRQLRPRRVDDQRHDLCAIADGSGIK